MFFTIGSNFATKKYGTPVLLVTVPSLKEIAIPKGTPTIETEMVDIDPQSLLCTMYLATYQEMEKNIKKT